MLLAAFNKFEAQMLKQIDESIVARAKIAQEKQAREAIDAPPTPDKTKPQVEAAKEQADLVEYLNMNDEAKDKVQRAEYEAIKKSIVALVKKDNDQGKFEEKTGLVDTRTDQSLLSQ